MKKFLTKRVIYIGLFAVLYLIVAFSSFWHAIAFFGLANNSWMSIILAFAFEVGQAAVLFSLLTSQKDRGRIMPWVLMTMFTLVQVIGNVFSSYKYLITNSVENLRYFKEPIFIWTELPDAQTTVIITYIVGAILPIAALLLTSMITNYLTDNAEEQNNSGILGDYSILQMENQGLREQIDNLKNQLENNSEQIYNLNDTYGTRKENSEENTETDSGDNGTDREDTKAPQAPQESTETSSGGSAETSGSDDSTGGTEADRTNSTIDNVAENKEFSQNEKLKKSHFINL